MSYPVRSSFYHFDRIQSLFLRNNVTASIIHGCITSSMPLSWYDTRLKGCQEMSRRSHDTRLPQMQATPSSSNRLVRKRWRTASGCERLKGRPGMTKDHFEFIFQITSENLVTVHGNAAFFSSERWNAISNQECLPDLVAAVKIKGP